MRQGFITLCVAESEHKVQDKIGRACDTRIDCYLHMDTDVVQPGVVAKVGVLFLAVDLDPRVAEEEQIQECLYEYVDVAGKARKRVLLNIHDQQHKQDVEHAGQDHRHG